MLHSVKGAYERFHKVSYADDAITHAVFYASSCIKTGCLPGTAVDVIDEAGAAAQLQQGKLPEEVVELQKRVRFIVQRMEASIENHEFEKARFYSGEERQERNNLERAKNTISTKIPPGTFAAKTSNELSASWLGCRSRRFASPERRIRVAQVRR